MTRPRRLIVQSYAPTRRALFVAATGLLVLLASYGSFEWGRRRGGFDVVGAGLDRSELQAELDRANAAVVALRAQSAELETLKASQSRERAEVSRTIGELQAQVAKGSQELAFYKGLVVRNTNSADIKIQSMRLAAGALPQAFVIKLTLAQTATPQNQVSGTLLVTVAGQSDGHADTLDLAKLTAGRLQAQPYTLRYFQNLQIDVVLPARFKPERLQIEARSTRKGATPLVQSFLWSVESN